MPGSRVRDQRQTRVGQVLLECQYDLGDTCHPHNGHARECGESNFRPRFETGAFVRAVYPVIDDVDAEIVGRLFPCRAQPRVVRLPHIHMDDAFRGRAVEERHRSRFGEVDEVIDDDEIAGVRSHATHHVDGQNLRDTEVDHRLDVRPVVHHVRRHRMVVSVPRDEHRAPVMQRADPRSSGSEGRVHGDVFGITKIIECVEAGAGNDSQCPLRPLCLVRFWCSRTHGTQPSGARAGLRDRTRRATAPITV